MRNAVEHSYDPEYWMRGYKERHRAMPAMGALLMADYRLFLESEELAKEYTEENILKGIQRIAISDLHSPQIVAGKYVTVPEQNQLELELLDLGATAAHYAAVDTVPGLGRPGNEFGLAKPYALTNEQLTWIDINLYWKSSKYLMEARMGGLGALKYFAASQALWLAHRYHYDSFACNESVLEAIMDTAPSGLRQAAGAPPEFWGTPDIPVGFGEIMNRITTRFDVEAGPIIDDFGNVRPDIAKKFTTEREIITRSNFEPADWKEFPSSGCPVRHTKLGPNVQAAFTEEQREWITSTVAEIDENGVMSYTWDPFRATVERFIPTLIAARDTYLGQSTSTT